MSRKWITEWLKSNDRTWTCVFPGETARRYAPLMQLQIKMPENSTNYLFRRKQTTNKVPASIFRAFQVGTKVRLML